MNLVMNLGNAPTAVIAMLLAGCTALPAGAPVPVADQRSLAQACPRAPVPPEYRFAPAAGLPHAVQAVVDGAVAEWRRWGQQIVDYRAVDWARSRAVRDLIRAGMSPAGEMPPGVADGPLVPVLAAVGCWENDPRMFRALREYWRPLQDSGGAVAEPGRRERHLDDLIDSAVAVSVARPPGWTEAWSAAFISFVAGTSDGSFRYSRSHAEYIAAAVEEARGGSQGHRYVARPVATFAPRPGDLACSYRAQPRREAWEPAAAEWRLGAAHCDVVVAVERSGDAARVLAVGGQHLPVGGRQRACAHRRWPSRRQPVPQLGAGARRPGEPGGSLADMRLHERGQAEAPGVDLGRVVLGLELRRLEALA